MKFTSRFDDVERLLRQTAEMLSLLQSRAPLPTENMHDVTAQLRSVQMEGSYLTPTDLYRVRTSLATVAAVREFFARTGDEGQPLSPLLAELFMPMATFPGIISDIDRIVNRFGEIADNASPTLFEIRRSIASASAALSTVMRRVIDRGVAEGVLDKDTTPSMRDGRLVIPVSAGMKRRVSGIVQDESATGKTAYVEPTEVVEASNRLRELHEKEKREIQRILIEITDTIRPHTDDMLRSYSLLGVYDFIRAKADVAMQFDAQMPVLERNMELDWFGAIHPVLALSLRKQGKEVVPLSLRLTQKERILIISGPNAGGKSVCLKTAGVVQYMMQCGMLPTMHSNSHACIFKSIFIDIGDEQSIENDLSTYSSHLRNMKIFLQRADAHTFILVDEMGSGTEPQIGGALAQAILIQLGREKVMGIVTTHYQNLKTFADNQDGFVNGAMLYDRQNMQPLFKLSIGNPGSSFALEIAKKIGLPSQVLDDAREIVGSDYVNMDKYLLDLARDRRYWANKRQSIKEKEHKLDALLDRYNEQVDDLKIKRREIIGDARKEASELLSTANAKLERTILEIRNAQAEKERTKQVRKELDEYRAQLNEQPGEKAVKGLREIKPRRQKKEQPKPIIPKETDKKPIGVGDYVRMSKGGTVGTVMSISGKQAEVAFGALRTRISVDKLIPALKPKVTAAEQVSSVSKATSDASRQRQLNFKQEIDLRGMRAAEALQAVAYFLDDAVQFGAQRVRILHGTGTGALRQSIRQYLQSVPDVKTFHDEDVRFGGAGITVVNLE